MTVAVTGSVTMARRQRRNGGVEHCHLALNLKLELNLILALPLNRRALP